MADDSADAPAAHEVPTRWLLLVYRVPSQSSRARVAVWRELKRLGGLYVQQAVCVLPDLPGLRTAMKEVRQRIEDLQGTSLFFVLDSVAGLPEALGL